MHGYRFIMRSRFAYLINAGQLYTRILMFPKARPKSRLLATHKKLFEILLHFRCKFVQKSEMPCSNMKQHIIDFQR